MAKLKLGPLVDDKPVRLTIELPAQVHRDLAAYAEVLGRESGQPVEPAKLVAPMVARFMATDRAFRRLKRSDTGAGALSRASDSSDQHRGDRREPGG